MVSTTFLETTSDYKTVIARPLSSGASNAKSLGPSPVRGISFHSSFTTGKAHLFTAGHAPTLTSSAALVTNSILAAATGITASFGAGSSNTLVPYPAVTSKNDSTSKANLSTPTPALFSLQMLSTFLLSSPIQRLPVLLGWTIGRISCPPSRQRTRKSSKVMLRILPLPWISMRTVLLSESLMCSVLPSGLIRRSPPLLW